MGDAQQPEARRSGKGAATPQESRHLKAAQPKSPKKAGGDQESRSQTGGPTPREQRPDHP
ncbi:hypothetical protein [Streptomyces avidinii]|uniref:Uncharacterized protein n=1 Tax=Streptomyces avidinii TaxID=1895 RepID=A0ABS4KZM1_STRAV|nr:hypothetical protein [Streptomyces avidinii]MBP2035478.1 hypothetical protein [Streptomyces avidinii]GGZ02197.1 hypothetical protein GCM10010343_29800 [Streptomyces avidinii]